MISNSLEAGDYVVLVLHKMFSDNSFQESSISFSHAPSEPLVTFSPTSRTLVIHLFDNLVVESLYHCIELVSTKHHDHISFTLRLLYADGRVIRSQVLGNAFSTHSDDWSLVATNLKQSTPRWNRKEDLKVDNVDVFSFELDTSFDYVVKNSVDNQTVFEVLVA